MPYNKELHESLPYVDKQYKKLLHKLSDAHKRDLKREVEFLIHSAAKTEGLTIKGIDK